MKYSIQLILFLFIFSSFHWSQADVDLFQEKSLKQFGFDGCTLFTEGTGSDPHLWEHCCLEHDLFYWAGGSKTMRLHADKNLRQCFRDTGHPTLAELVYLAVRAGRFNPLPFNGQQWGNAWSNKRNYRKLSIGDVVQWIRNLINMICLKR